MTSDQLQKRLDELKQEYALGETRLREVAQQEVLLRETLLRISGAIQVLQELLGETDAPAMDGMAAGT
jgi:hypothetical protein